MSRFITCCYACDSRYEANARSWRVVVALQDPFRLVPDKALVVLAGLSFYEAAAWRDRWFDTFPLKEDFDA